jgi:Trk K+ transport system NAD-binding subunit
MKRNGRHYLKAQIRDARVLLGESWVSLVVFTAVVFGGALIFSLAYHDPQNPAENLPYASALYVSFSLVFFQTLLPFPEEWYLQILFFLIPIVGLVAVADGVLRFGSALINKKNRDQYWQVAMASTYNNHIIVCGVGKVGYRVILELLKYEREVVAVEADENGRFIEKIRNLGVPLLIANARRTETLIKAGLQRADAIIPCTNDELANLDIALDARDINPDIKVVLRMFDSDLARRVEKGFDIHTAYSSSALAAPIFAASALRLNIQHSFYIGDDLLHLSKVIVSSTSKLLGWTLDTLQHQFNLSIVSYLHEGETDLHPFPEQKLCVDDVILVLASLETLRELHTLNVTRD